MALHPRKMGEIRMKGAKCQLLFLGILACHDVCYPAPPCSLYLKGLNSLKPEAEISISSLNMFILGGEKVAEMRLVLSASEQPTQLWSPAG